MAIATLLEFTEDLPTFSIVFDNKLPGEITNIYSDGFGVKVENGEVVFKVVQLEGKKAVLASDFINGYHENLVGKILN